MIISLFTVGRSWIMGYRIMGETKKEKDDVNIKHEAQII